MRLPRAAPPPGRGARIHSTASLERMQEPSRIEQNGCA